MSLSVQAMDFLRPSIGARLPLSTETFLSYILPPVLCHYGTALSVLLPGTQPIRIVLLPVTLLVAFRAAVSLDFTNLIGDDPRHVFFNIDLWLSMILISMRSAEWTFQKRPFRRIRLGSVSSSKDEGVLTTTSTLTLDALDLICNLRGIGWDWSRGLYIPPETRSTNSKASFLISTFALSMLHTFACGIFHSAVQSFGPDSIGSLSGGTIFDQSLPFFARYARSSIIATLTAFVVVTVMQCGYYWFTLLNVLLLGHHPTQWPPLFDEPWRATSLREMWGKRWHQVFRQPFSFVGRCFSLVAGRAGMVMGAFLASALLHQAAVMVLDPEAEPFPTFLSFGMMGVGILLEEVFIRATGRRVGGWMGWAWTMSWMLFWGNVMIDAWARAGMLGCSSFLDQFAVVRAAVRTTVVGFDGWLHTL